jgi:hypothetical protein
MHTARTAVVAGGNGHGGHSTQSAWAGACAHLNGEEAELLTEPPVVTPRCLLLHRAVRRELLAALPRRAVDARQHRTCLVPPPVRARGAVRSNATASGSIAPVLGTCGPAQRSHQCSLLPGSPMW